MSSTWSSASKYFLDTMTGNSLRLVNEYTVVVYWSPSRLMDWAFLANTTGTSPKWRAAQQAMPMPDASMVRILVMVLPAKCRAHSCPIWSNRRTSH